MPRLFLASLPVLGLLLAGFVAAEEKDKQVKKAPTPSPVTIIRIDDKKSEITFKFADAKGKEQEKTITLNKDVRLLDETGRTVKLDVFKAGQYVFITESEGKLSEVRRAVRPHPGGRLCDAVKVLIEMTACEEGCVEEVQRIYDELRKLDTDKNGKIDPVALKAARERITGERVENLIKRLDSNQDGKVGKDEAKGWVKEHFENLDANKNGILDRDELLKAAVAKPESKPKEPEKK